MCRGGEGMRVSEVCRGRGDVNKRRVYELGWWVNVCVCVGGSRCMTWDAVRLFVSVYV